MSLLLFFRKKVKELFYDIRELRSDDIALIQLISNHITQNCFEHVSVLDSYPRENASVPSVAVNHKMSTDRGLEVGSQKFVERRVFDVDVIGRGRGESEDLASQILTLRERSTDTLDNRKLYLENIRILSRFKGHHALLEKRKYFKINLDMINSIAELYHDEEFSSNQLGVDLDVLVKDISIGSRGYLFDKLTDTPSEGIHEGTGIYLFRPNVHNIFLVFSIGLGHMLINNTVNFNNFLAKRTQISCHYSRTDTHIYTYIYLNGVLKSTLGVPYVASLNRGTKNISLGQFIDENELYQHRLSLELYGARLTQDPSRTYSKNKEYLSRSRTYDICYFSINEGIGSLCYNKSHRLNQNLRITNTEWENYLEINRDLVDYTYITLEVITKSLNQRTF